LQNCRNTESRGSLPPLHPARILAEECYGTWGEASLRALQFFTRTNTFTGPLIAAP
jgi:hypothetical protein